MSMGNALAVAGAALIGVALIAPTLKSGSAATPHDNRTEASVADDSSAQRLSSPETGKTNPPPVS